MADSKVLGKHKVGQTPSDAEIKRIREALANEINPLNIIEHGSEAHEALLGIETEEDPKLLANKQAAKVVPPVMSERITESRRTHRPFEPIAQGFSRQSK